MTPKDVLKELFDLLEEYAPIWYTEEHRMRAEAVLNDAVEAHLRLGTRQEDAAAAAAPSPKTKLCRPTSRPVLAAVTARKPVKPVGGPSAH